MGGGGDSKQRQSEMREGGKRKACDGCDWSNVLQVLYFLRVAKCRECLMGVRCFQGEGLSLQECIFIIFFDTLK